MLNPEFEFDKKKALILIFVFIGCAVAISTPLNHIDSNNHLDYTRAIQNTGTIPANHPHVNQTDASSIPFGYPIGFHLAMSIFPHWVSLYEALGVLFASVCLIFVIKLNKLLGYGESIKVLIPLVFAFSFSRLTVCPHPDMFALMLVLISSFATLKYLSEGKVAYLLLGIGTGFYAGITREVAILTLLFAWAAFLWKHRDKWKRLLKTSIPIVVLTGIGYYLMNCVIKGVSFFYPLFGTGDSQAYHWYLSHVGFWEILSHGYWLQAASELVSVFSLFLLLFLLVKPRDKKLAILFGSQIVFIFAFMPSSAGLQRYIMFTLPFLAVAYGNAWKKITHTTKVWLPVLIIGILAVYPAQGFLGNTIPSDFDKAADEIDQYDTVLARRNTNLAYETKCRAAWTSLFWSGDLYDTFENVSKVDNFIRKHGVTHVLIDKNLIVPSDSPMIGNDAVGFPQDWVNKVDNLGVKILETKNYRLYRVVENEKS